MPTYGLAPQLSEHRAVGCRPVAADRGTVDAWIHAGVLESGIDQVLDIGWIDVDVDGMVDLKCV